MNGHLLILYLTLCCPLSEGISRLVVLNNKVDSDINKLVMCNPNKLESSTISLCGAH
jgi:hypothetical protein